MLELKSSLVGNSDGNGMSESCSGRFVSASLLGWAAGFGVLTGSAGTSSEWSATGIGTDPVVRTGLLAGAKETGMVSGAG